MEAAPVQPAGRAGGPRGTRTHQAMHGCLQPVFDVFLEVVDALVKGLAGAGLRDAVAAPGGQDRQRQRHGKHHARQHRSLLPRVPLPAPAGLRLSN